MNAYMAIINSDIKRIALFKGFSMEEEANVAPIGRGVGAVWTEKAVFATGTTIKHLTFSIFDLLMCARLTYTQMRKVRLTVQLISSHEVAPIIILVYESLI